MFPPGFPVGCCDTQTLAPILFVYPRLVFRWKQIPPHPPAPTRLDPNRGEISKYLFNRGSWYPASNANTTEQTQIDFQKRISITGFCFFFFKSHSPPVCVGLAGRCEDLALSSRFLRALAHVSPGRASAYRLTAGQQNTSAGLFLSPQRLQWTHDTWNQPLPQRREPGLDLGCGTGAVTAEWRTLAPPFLSCTRAHGLLPEGN